MKTRISNTRYALGDWFTLPIDINCVEYITEFTGMFPEAVIEFEGFGKIIGKISINYWICERNEQSLLKLELGISHLLCLNVSSINCPIRLFVVINLDSDNELNLNHDQLREFVANALNEYAGAERTCLTH